MIIYQGINGEFCMIFYETLLSINRHKGEDVTISYVKNVNGKWPLVQSFGQLVEATDGTEIDGSVQPYIALKVNTATEKIPLTHIQYVETMSGIKIFYNVFAKNQFLTDKEKLIQLFNQDAEFCNKVYETSNPAYQNSAFASPDFNPDVNVSTAEPQANTTTTTTTTTTNESVTTQTTDQPTTQNNDTHTQSHIAEQPRFIDTQPMSLDENQTNNTYAMPINDFSAVPTNDPERFNVTSEPDFGARQEESMNEVNLYDVTISPLESTKVELNDNTFPKITLQQKIYHNMYNELATDNVEEKVDPDNPDII